MQSNIKTLDRITGDFANLLDALDLARVRPVRLRPGHLGKSPLSAQILSWSTPDGASSSLANEQSGRGRYKGPTSLDVMDWTLAWETDGTFEGSFRIPDGHAARAALEGGAAIVYLKRHRDDDADWTECNQLYSEVIVNGRVEFRYRPPGDLRPTRRVAIAEHWICAIQLYGPTWSTTAQG
ncbi:MAG: hypothetical protein R3F34_17470 [Planctomycetota bacterium]